MPTALNSFPVITPGKYGLNLQEASSLLGTDWATEATNCVIDSAGRLASRKGWTTPHTAIATNPIVKSIFEYIDSSQTAHLISAAGNKIYSGATGILSDITGTATITSDHWKFQNFNTKLVAWQASHLPMVYTGTGTFTTIQSGYTAWAATTAYSLGAVRRSTTGNTTLIFKVTTAGTSAGTEPTWNTTFLGTTTDGTVTWTTYKIPDGNEALAAFGRIWATDSTGSTIFYSGLLDHTDWASASSGNIDLSTVWPVGRDQCVALAEFGGNLIIFGQKSIIVYAGADDPANMYKVDSLSGIGCVGRDTVQSIGTDLLYLSYTGVRSFGRTLIQRNMPLQELTKHVRDNLVLYINGATPANIKSTYSPLEGFYLVAFPDNTVTFCLDTRMPLEDGAYRVTKWDTINPRALFTTKAGATYVGQAGYSGLYSGYLDNSTPFNMATKFGWTDFGIGAMLKVLKKVSGVIYTGYRNYINLTWVFDFLATKNSKYDYITASSIAEYGANGNPVAEWGIAEYGGGAGLHNVQVEASRTGTYIQLGVDVQINNSIVAVQQLTVYLKRGRKS